MMIPTQKEIDAIALLKDLPVNFSIDGLTTFMIISQLQLAMRHPGNRGQTSQVVRDIVIDLQNQLQTRSPDIKPILDKGWHPEFDVDIDEKITQVHNVFTLYESSKPGEPSLLSVSSRPQDWGDPSWHYEFIKLEWKHFNTLYIQNAHVWTTTKMAAPEILGKMGGAIGMIMQPGKKPELCDRSHLDEDDFWCEEWGEMPPYYFNTED